MSGSRRARPLPSLLVVGILATALALLPSAPPLAAGPGIGISDGSSRESGARVFGVLGAAPLAAQTPGSPPPVELSPPRYHPVPSLREEAAERQRWVEERVTRVLPALMEEYGVEMWILSMREYGEDPVFHALASPTTFAARRRSIYVLHRTPEGGFDRLALGGGDQGGIFQAFRSSRPAPTEASGELWGDEQWRLLRELLEARDPTDIVVNIDEDWAFADGLGAGEREALERALEPWADRVRREPRLAVDFIAHRIPEMLPRYQRIMETVHAMIAEAFSNAVITPGETTTDDVAWWLRERIRGLGWTTWFHPSVSVQRAGASPPGPFTGVIERGDLLWTDVGVTAYGLATDTQHMGYVLAEGEVAPPEGLDGCLAASNRMQDILLEEMVPGRSGNEILAMALARVRGEGIDGTIYTHPIGDHGHGAGPLIGRWDAQEGVPVRGDHLLRPSTWHSVELQATVPVAEWGGQPARCMQEEEAWLDEAGDRHWVFRRQTRFHLVW